MAHSRRVLRAPRLSETWRTSASDQPTRPTGLTFTILPSRPTLALFAPSFCHLRTPALTDSTHHGTFVLADARQRSAPSPLAAPAQLSVQKRRQVNPDDSLPGVATCRSPRPLVCDRPPPVSPLLPARPWLVPPPSLASGDDVKRKGARNLAQSAALGASVPASAAA